MFTGGGVAAVWQCSQVPNLWRYDMINCSNSNGVSVPMKDVGEKRRRKASFTTGWTENEIPSRRRTSAVLPVFPAGLSSTCAAEYREGEGARSANCGS